MRKSLVIPALLLGLAVGCGSSAPVSPISSGAASLRPLKSQPRAITFDDQADGRPDLTIGFKYNRAGQVIRRTYDFQSDGSVELSVDGETSPPVGTINPDSDDDGHLDDFQEQKEGLYVLDEDQDGEVDFSYRELVDSQGRVVGRSYDTNADGVTDRRIHWEYDGTLEKGVSPVWPSRGD